MTWTPIVARGFTIDQFPDYIASHPLTKWRPRFVVVHNTYMPTLAQWKAGPTTPINRLHNLERYYKGMGWHAGPHLFVADDFIWAFTPLNVPGVHSPSWNGVSWGVETVGDFEKEEFKNPQKSLLADALGYLHMAAGIDPKTMKFHKEDPRTTHNCPGKNMHKDELISLVEQALVSEGMEHNALVDRETT